MEINLKNRNFLKLLDYNADEIHYLLQLATKLKKAKASGLEEQKLCSKNVALIFEKTSTRTRCAFEVAVAEVGYEIRAIPATGVINLQSC